MEKAIKGGVAIEADVVEDFKSESSLTGRKGATDEEDYVLVEGSEFAEEELMFLQELDLVLVERGVRASESTDTAQRQLKDAGGAPQRLTSVAGALVVYHGPATPVETEYYEVLQVDPSATLAQIRKAYRKLAVKLHPDKNPGDHASNERFAQLGKAYQVLCNPKTRRKYDKHGKEGVVEEPFLDAMRIFNSAFGTKSYQPLVAELMMAHITGKREAMTQEELQSWQQGREKELAAKLLVRLQPWLMGLEEQFVEECLELVEELKKDEFAFPMLHIMGYTYHHKAEFLLGLQSVLGIPGYCINAVKFHSHYLKSQLRAGVGLATIGILQAKVDSGDEAPEDALLEFLNSIWLITALDVENTLGHVVELLVMEKGLTKEEKEKRALGIMKLGKIILQA